ncbi:hypothetical protein F7725_018961 [Dissostichus mawsoni]|uniref:Uncharacterized protein n=1 Tax=Dissostichus mawsoni TaxID=36200 RepID=A0A7J5XSZ9_DISMA|nr:hypothetical protein F7725_018961 [Dissostichus mawsoni]
MNSSMKQGEDRYSVALGTAASKREPRKCRATCSGSMLVTRASFQRLISYTFSFCSWTSIFHRNRVRASFSTCRQQEGLSQRLTILEAGHVVAVEDVPPAVDVDDARGPRDEQHQRELHHVADLNQHGNRPGLIGRRRGRRGGALWYCLSLELEADNSAGPWRDRKRSREQLTMSMMSAIVRMKMAAMAQVFRAQRVWSIQRADGQDEQQHLSHCKGVYEGLHGCGEEQHHTGAAEGRSALLLLLHGVTCLQLRIYKPQGEPQSLVQQLVELLLVLLSVDHPLCQVPQPQPPPGFLWFLGGGAGGVNAAVTLCGVNQQRGVSIGRGYRQLLMYFRDNYQVGLDAALLQVVAAVSSVSWLCVELSMKTLHGALRDKTNYDILRYDRRLRQHLFSDESTVRVLDETQSETSWRTFLHFVCHSDVRGPDVVLPAFLSQNPPRTKHQSISDGFQTVDHPTHPIRLLEQSLLSSPLPCTHEMASTMASPIMMEHAAWSSLYQFVEASEELVEQFDQLMSAAGRRQLSEAHDVCKQNTAGRQETRKNISDDIMLRQ